jgi:Ca-activated chloride channel homolog
LPRALNAGARRALASFVQQIIPRRISLVYPLLALSLAASAYSQEVAPGPPLPPPIRVQVTEVSIGVTVTGARGSFVKGLHANDFRVFDNGAPRPIISFLSDDDPGSVVLLLETGPGAFLNEANELHAAAMFLESLPASYRVAIVSYSRNPALLLDFTADKTVARGALAAMNFKAGYSELNLVDCVVSTIDWLAALPGKKTIVLLSSGIDTSSRWSWPLAQQKIFASGVRILAVSVTEEMRRPPKRKVLSREQRESLKYVQTNAADADRGLRQLAEPTGGQVYFPKNEKEFGRAFSKLAQSVSHEYRFSIAPTPPDGQLHTLDVKVNRPWSNIDFRKGYFIPSPSAHE